jgi:hypothetical protein
MIKSVRVFHNTMSEQFKKEIKQLVAVLDSENRVFQSVSDKELGWYFREPNMHATSIATLRSRLQRMLQSTCDALDRATGSVTMTGDEKTVGLALKAINQWVVGLTNKSVTLPPAPKAPMNKKKTENKDDNCTTVHGNTFTLTINATNDKGFEAAKEAVAQLQKTLGKTKKDEDKVEIKNRDFRTNHDQFAYAFSVLAGRWMAKGGGTISGERGLVTDSNALTLAMNSTSSGSMSRSVVSAAPAARSYWSRPVAVVSPWGNEDSDSYSDNAGRASSPKKRRGSRGSRSPRRRRSTSGSRRRRSTTSGSRRRHR